MRESKLWQYCQKKSAYSSIAHTSLWRAFWRALVNWVKQCKIQAMVRERGVSWDISIIFSLGGLIRVLNKSADPFHWTWGRSVTPQICIPRCRWRQNSGTARCPLTFDETLGDKTEMRKRWLQREVRNTEVRDDRKGERFKLEWKNNIFSFNGIGQPSKCHFFLFTPPFVSLKGLKCIGEYLFESWLFALGVWLRCVNVGQTEKEGTLTSGLLVEAWPQQTGRVILMSGHVLFSSIPTGICLAFQNISVYMHSVNRTRKNTNICKVAWHIIQ